ncbi:hypothetical protein GCM10010440_40090 [Kitasatospora cinereorecta]
MAYWIARSVWFRKCWTNAEVLAPGNQRSGRGWAGAVWFVPLVNVWLPRRIMLDIARASGLTDERLVNLWWGAGVLTFLAGAASMFRGVHLGAVLVACALTLVRASALIRVIGQVTAAQAEALDLPPVSELGDRPVTAQRA